MFPCTRNAKRPVITERLTRPVRARRRQSEHRDAQEILTALIARRRATAPCSHRCPRNIDRDVETELRAGFEYPRRQVQIRGCNERFDGIPIIE
jgi:hypothetical protein